MMNGSTDCGMRCVCIIVVLFVAFAGVVTADNAYAEMSDTAKGGIGGGLIGALAGSLGGYAGAGALIGGGVGLAGGAISDASKEDKAKKKKEDEEQKKQEEAIEEAYQKGLKDGKRVSYTEGTEHHKHISLFGDALRD